MTSLLAPPVTRLVVKVGGAVAGESADRILGLVEEGHQVCVVHGAGPQITQEMQRRSIPVEFIGGRRRTSLAALDVVRASMAEVNAELCAALGDIAVPVFGDRDGLLAVPVPPLGQVGDPLPCRPARVLAAFAAGLVPVVAPLAVGPLNVNADDAAAALALGLGARTLVFLTDVPGLYIDGDVVDEIGVAEAERLLDAGAFEGGIVPKLRAAAIAAGRGVSAHIGRTTVVA
jgi:acetylglutamate kinase